MALFTYPAISITSTLPAGASTEAKQDSQISLLTDIENNTDGLEASLTSLNAKDFATETTLASLAAEDFATETTLAALNAKVTAVNTGAVVVSSSALPTGAATETTLASLAAEDFATETTLAALNAKVTAVNTGAVVVSSSALPTGAATETTLAALNAKVTAVDTGAVTISAALPAGNNNIGDVDVVSLPGTVQQDIADLNARVAGSLVPETHDYLSLAYVTVGNGIGEIETVTYKTGGSGGTTVATLTLAYDVSNRLSSVTRS